MRVRLPEPGSWKGLRFAAAASLFLHVTLFALAFFLQGLPSLVVARKGEPLFIELPKPEEEEAAPRGNPALPVAPRPEPARPPVAKAPPPAPKPAPRVEMARPIPKATPAPAKPAPAPVMPAPEPPSPQVAKAAPEPEAEGTKATPAAAPKEEAKPEPSAPSAGETRTALARPPSEEGRPGGGGGLRGGRGGIEGEPISLDTKDPRYTDYFDKIRRRIRENWIYPREAGERGIVGQLVIEFAIRKDGWLQAVELKRSSGVEILDQYAMNALKLAQPFPPVPDVVSKGTLPIAGIFTYQIVDSGLLNQFLR